MATARRPTAERRAEIADAALSIIEDHGIVALTTSSLADAVGLTTGALFRHFASLDAILDEVARRAESLLRATLPEHDLPPDIRLERFLEARAAVAGKHAGLLRLMTSEQFTLALPAAARRRLRAIVRETRAQVTRTLAEGQAAGVFRADLPADAIAIVVLGTLKMIAFSTSTGAGDRAEAGRVRVTLRALLSPPRSRDGREARRRPTATGRARTAASSGAARR